MGKSLTRKSSCTYELDARGRRSWRGLLIICMVSCGNEVQDANLHKGLLSEKCSHGRN
jgi:hypothetical protein